MCETRHIANMDQCSAKHDLLEDENRLDSKAFATGTW